MPSLVTLIDGTVPTASDFNGNYTALNNAIGSSTAISAWALGEIPYASATNTLARLTPGAAGQVLTMQASGIPGWSAGTNLDALTGLALSNNGSDATNDIDIAVGAAASEDATVVNRAIINLTSGLTKQLDAVWAAGTNQGMRASGAAITNTTYHIFAIMRPDTGNVDIAADTSVTGANIAANTNSAYTKIRRIGSILREGGSIVAFSQEGDEFLRLAAVLDVDVTNAGTSAVTRTLSVPIGLKVQALFNMVTVHVATNFFTLVSSLDQTDAVASESALPLNNIGSSNASDPNDSRMFRIRTNTSAQIRTRQNASGAGDILRIATLGWIDRRGKG